MPQAILYSSENICIKYIQRFLKLFYIVLLVVLFIVYFGTPNLQKFLEQKTIFLESKIKDKMLERLLHSPMTKIRFGPEM